MVHQSALVIHRECPRLQCFKVITFIKGLNWCQALALSQGFKGLWVIIEVPQKH